jgi:pumilio family protein 6
LIEELKASVIHMIHTPDGAKAGLHCIWFGTAKDRKLMLKTVKEFLVKVITSESGYLLSLGIIDSVDDTG